MTARRIVLQAPRYWPLSGGCATSTRLVAEGLQASGHAVTVVTARYLRQGPSRFTLHCVPVMTLDRPGSSGWALLRYLLAWGRWLRSHRQAFDVLHLSGARYEAYLALGLLSADVHVWIRAEGTAQRGDRSWWQTHPWGHRVLKRCLAFAQSNRSTHPRGQARMTIIAESDVQRSEFLGAGFPEESVCVIAPGVPLAEPRTEARIRAARRLLADIHYTFHVPCTAPVGLFVGPLSRHQQLPILLDAWCRVVRQHPEARLWIIGNGPHYRRLWDQVRDRNLDAHVSMPGTFEEPSPLYYAADFLIRPSSEPDIPWSVLEAMAHGMPVVLVDNPVHRHVVPSSWHRFLARDGSAEAIAEAVVHLLGQPGQWSVLGEEGRRRIATQFSWQNMTQQYAALLRSCGRSDSTTAQPSDTF